MCLTFGVIHIWRQILGLVGRSGSIWWWPTAPVIPRFVNGNGARFGTGIFSHVFDGEKAPSCRSILHFLHAPLKYQEVFDTQFWQILINAKNVYKSDLFDAYLPKITCPHFCFLSQFSAHPHFQFANSKPLGQMKKNCQKLNSKSINWLLITNQFTRVENSTKSWF